jgi:signal transduction histidine kinase
MSDLHTSQEVSDQLETIRVQLSKIHHDLNNPMSVISGNVELLAELTKALGVEGELGGPLEDLARAVDQMADNADRLLAVRGLLGELNEQLNSAS